MEEYRSEIKLAFNVESKKDMFIMSDIQNSTPIGRIIDTDECVTIKVNAFILMNVHNPSSKIQDYRVIVLKSDAGKYHTSSESFINRLLTVYDVLDLESSSEVFSVEVYKRPSKNNENGYLTVSLV